MQDYSPLFDVGVCVQGAGDPVAFLRSQVMLDLEGLEEGGGVPQFTVEEAVSYLGNYFGLHPRV